MVKKKEIKDIAAYGVNKIIERLRMAEEEYNLLWASIECTEQKNQKKSL